MTYHNKSAFVRCLNGTDSNIEQLRQFFVSAVYEDVDIVSWFECDEAWRGHGYLASGLCIAEVCEL